MSLLLGSQYKSEKLHKIIQYYSGQVNENLHQLGFAHISNERVHYVIASRKKKYLLTNTSCLARLFIEFTKRSRRTQCDWAQVAAWFGFQDNNNLKHFLDTRRNLNIHKMLIRRADDFHKDIHKAFT